MSLSRPKLPGAMTNRVPHLRRSLTAPKVGAHLASIVLACSAAVDAGHAQQPIGTILLEDATLTGDLSVTNGRAVLNGSSSITARDHTAHLILSRGGAVSVCATSGLHVAQSAAQSTSPTHPLMLALDRGAIEIQTAAQPNDAVITPDLRFVVQSDGPLDLRMRVTRNGDTCVENRGDNAPVLAITDAFTDAIYELRRGQHVLFEHGSLKEVVDHETSPCGCPPDAPPGVSIAEALLAPGTPAAKQAQAEAQHPFPAAVSQGLAPPPPVPQSTPGVANAQVRAQLGYSGAGESTITAAVAAPATASTAPPAPPKPGLAHRIGHFFRRIFS